MALFIILGHERDIFDIITSFGVLLMAFGLLLNVRSNYIAIINKCTSEFRDIVRKSQMENLPKGYTKDILAKDICGLFNEQLYYMNKLYLPKSFRQEWKKTINNYIFNAEYDGIIITDKMIFEFQRLNKYYLKHKEKMI